ncbi:cobalt ECF transporter T component CbiQ [Actinokineospora bangkokensis]|uniref:Cobalt ECF transporter T component CbiQ n=1 Tax=Actinokineospora bangkokensis TaxID=1193682 RepID=A0A1Q9LQJ3_9PSEU|nr:cobalt ECF transporter T component CbiQ [Actinokineospora bangkokensis]OLR94290.1 cobalt ECF transporter T component CbiQ [Actinokineospora bangkokensis]
MGAGHAHLLHRPGDTPVHRLPPQVKLVAALVVVLCVVSTPRTEFWAFGLYLLVLAGVWAVARIPPHWLAKRALIEAPFVVLALALPFLAGGPSTRLLGVTVSETGLLTGWNILVKGTLGVLVSLTLAATTTPRDLLVGLQRLRVPSLVTTIATLMLRYLDVITAEARRMRVARICRGHDPRFLWQVGATAKAVGTLFIRSYERGERVHLAMVSRGWTGAMPDAGGAAAPRTWLLGLAPALGAAAVLGATLWG